MTKTAGDGSNGEIGEWIGAGFLAAHNPVENPGTPIYAERNFGETIDLYTPADIGSDGSVHLGDSNAVVVIDATAGDVPISLPFYARYRTRMHFTILRIDNSAFHVYVQPVPGSSDELNGSNANKAYINYQNGVLDVWCYDDSGGTHTGSGHGKYFTALRGIKNLVEMRRMITPLTPHVVGDYVLSAGWGSTANVQFINSLGGADVTPNDVGGSIAITPNGTGIAASPTVALTFKDGAWSQYPLVMASKGQGGGSPWSVQSVSTTQVIFLLNGTPVAGTGYWLRWDVAK